MIARLLLLLLLAGCSAHNPLVPPPTDAAGRAAGGYLSLSSGPLVPLKLASAVVVRPGVAVTNRHVVEGKKAVKARTASGRTFLICDARLSEKYDLAVLLIPCDAGEVLRAGPPIRRSERVFALGTALGWPYLEGVVRVEAFPFLLKESTLKGARRETESGYPVNDGFLYEGETRKGFSGGPVINGAGELVGVNQGYAKRIKAEAELAHPGRRHGIAYHVDAVLKEVDALLRGAPVCAEQN